MNHASMLAKAADRYPDRPAISVGTEVVHSYAEMARRTAGLAASLRGECGLEIGDRVAIVAKNCAEYLEAMYGCWWAGVAAVPVNAKLHPKEIAFILDNSGTRVVIATPELAEAVRGVSAETPTVERVISVGDEAYSRMVATPPMDYASVPPDALAWLFYTSGTTGRPKGAMLTHRNLTVTVMNYFSDVDGIEPEDCMIHCAPMSHGSGIYALPHIARAANNVVPESGGYGVAETLDLIAHWPGATFFFAPTMITRLITSELVDGADLSNLKTIVYGGAPMYLADTKRALDILGPKLVQIYGQGEAPMTITGLGKRVYKDREHPRWEAAIASAGYPRTDVEVRIVDEDGTPLPSGEIGEITCRGDIVMAGYWDNPEATAKSLRDGWLWTGDVGTMDPDGLLTLKDRSKDMIISGGTNIYPREIEEVLLTHPAVLECAVVGRPHPDWGEEVIAFVVPRGDAAPTEEELDALCLENIARFKRPKAYRIVPTLQKNNYGKILKTVLRDDLADEVSA